jgi:hypothetical protein
MTGGAEKRRRRERYLAIFLIGIVAGGSSVLLYMGHEMEDLILQNRNLKLLYEEKREEVEELKQSQRVARKKQETVVEEIRVTVMEPRPHEYAYIETQVIHYIEKDLSPLKGKRTEQVAEMHEILHELLLRREYVMEDKMVEVRLKTVHISRILHVFVTVQVKPLEARA